MSIKTFGVLMLTSTLACAKAKNIASIKKYLIFSPLLEILDYFKKIFVNFALFGKLFLAYKYKIHYKAHLAK